MDVTLTDAPAVISVATVIADVEARLARDPGALALRAEGPAFLEKLRHSDAAAREYLAVLGRDPVNLRALNALGLLCVSGGNREAARTLFSAAVLHGPDQAVPHANLAYLYLMDGYLPSARTLYEHALQLDPALAIAHHGLADVLVQLGDTQSAQRHRSLGMQYHPITFHPYAGNARPVRLLALGSATFGNLATAAYFDDRVFAVASLVVEHYDPAVPLPPHDLVFNVIGDGDLCGAALTKAATIIRLTSAPIVNDPSAVLATSRAANAERLGRIAGVVAPRVATVSRSLLVGARAEALVRESGFAYPLLVRSPGYHGGDHFVKVDRGEDLSEAILALPGSELLLIEYLDVRDEFGDTRKYRAIIVGDTFYPLHVAISRRWKVHYFSADMRERAEHRREDAAYLTDMHAKLGANAMAALERIRVMLQLDYGGIDFSLDAAGNVVVFEANATMTVPLPEDDPMWDYRREPVAGIHAAVRRMLVRRADVAGTRA